MEEKYEKNSNNFAYIAIVAIVAVVAVIVLVMSVGTNQRFVTTTGTSEDSTGFAATGTTRITLVKANSCDADDTCEAKAITANYINSNYLSVNTLTGAGTAYACVTNDGKLFRSNKPCDQYNWKAYVEIQLDDGKLVTLTNPGTPYITTYNGVSYTITFVSYILDPEQVIIGVNGEVKTFIEDDYKSVGGLSIRVKSIMISTI